ncbi:pimelyl-[acyl-carrier protein] methyl ester esterase [Virgibacillus salexigens]|uniref:Pimelyl-[acyl-carrier protein] methyl ester esterase n=2 Tax=Bacillaceae TaxID=186817 RepID=A0A024Q908_9BACI|nr:pimelyl-[acyl-carrier protein] methyl ester esterase [Virgibacillus massiliensis]
MGDSSSSSFFIRVSNIFEYGKIKINVVNTNEKVCVKMKKIIKYILIITSLLVFIGFSVFWIWSEQTYEASNNLSTFLGNDTMEYQQNWLVFEPENQQAKTGIILYPGAKVEPEAYSYYGDTLSKEGYLVIIPEVLFNFAIFDQNIAQEIMDYFPTVVQWIIGGHSLGGVAAASFAFNNPTKLDGLILLGSYPTDNNNFTGMDLPMLSIYAKNDGLTTPKEIQETQHLLSQHAELQEIQGGNHAQFGIYGEQKGDGNATISVEEQQRRITDTIKQWLDDANL